MERDTDLSQKEQARERERSQDARRKRKDSEDRAKSLDYLRHTNCDHGFAELPPRSRPGSSRDWQPLPPKEKSPHDKELDRIEELLDEMLLIKERCEIKTETGVLTSDVKKYQLPGAAGQVCRRRGKGSIVRQCVPHVRPRVAGTTLSG